VRGFFRALETRPSDRLGGPDADGLHVAPATLTPDTSLISEDEDLVIAPASLEIDRHPANHQEGLAVAHENALRTILNGGGIHFFWIAQLDRYN